MPDTRAHTGTERSRQWRTVVHDDPINTMTYVAWVFRTYFGMSAAVAHARMLEVHTAGRATVSRGPRERMEMDVTAMHSYGLRATIEPDACEFADSSSSPSDSPSDAGA